MPILEYFILCGVLFPLVLGTGTPRTSAAGLVPSFIFYNVTVAFYSVPIAWLLATKGGNNSH
jgi:hypothetical protein